MSATARSSVDHSHAVIGATTIHRLEVAKKFFAGDGIVAETEKVRRISVSSLEVATIKCRLMAKEMHSGSS